LGETVVGEEVTPLRCPLIGNEMAYVTSKVCGSGAKTRDGFVYNMSDK